MRHKIFHITERGQAIILIAAAAIGLIAMVGLIVDGGILLIEYGRLKRAIDAASLSAALQYREGYTITELENAAEEFLNLNQSNVFNIDVQTCDSAPGDPELCPPLTIPPTPPRKLARVIASRHVRFGFLRVIGIYETDITAQSIGEAASVDLVIVLDTSAAMAFEGGGDPTTGDDPADDPSTCNPADNCQPLRDIKDYAVNFVNQYVYFPYDRVAIITFDRNVHLIMPLDATDGMTDPDAKEAAVIAAINGLTVFQPAQICPDPVSAASPVPNCLNYPPPGTYHGLEYPLYRYNLEHGNNDSSSVPSSNIGDAVWLASNEFGLGRQDSLWVTILLSGGAANTGCYDPATCGDTTADGRICPSTTWATHYCRDNSTVTRHCTNVFDVETRDRCLAVDGTLFDVTLDVEHYDADDYARDAADFLANPKTGQGVVIFSIGLGNPMDPGAGGATSGGPELMEYAALTAGNESGDQVNHGLYYFAPTTDELVEIFRNIAENIATRLSQ